MARMSCHYLIEGQTSPAVTAEELLELRRGGIIGDESLVWESGLSDWVPFHVWQAQQQRAPAMPPVPPRRRETEPEPAPTADTPRMVRCGACGQTWAEALTDGATCKSCLAKGVAAQREKELATNVEFRVKSDNRYYYLLFAVSLLAALTWLTVFRGSSRRFFARSMQRESAAATSDRAPVVGAAAAGFTPPVATASAIPAPRELAPGKWRTKDFDKWPRLVFVSRAEFRTAEYRYPPSSVFLVRASKNLIVGVTAGTTLRGPEALPASTFPGVAPAELATFLGHWKAPGWKVAEANRELEGWTAELGRNEPALRFKGISEKGGDAMASQVLDLAPLRDWPCTPLEVRRGGLEQGEELAIVYADRVSTGHRQLLAQGRTVKAGQEFVPLDFAAPVSQYEGMLGGVALDKDGRFAGTVVAVIGGPEDGKLTRVLLECSARTAAKAGWPTN